jgi:hypothetical protein
MKLIKEYKLFLESRKDRVSYKNLVSEICTCMVLLNNQFLDNLLDRGLKARYSENSNIFITDLKNLLLTKNRLFLGKFVGDKCIQDEELSRVTNLFDGIEFDIEKDWDNLVNSRLTARNIIDKLLPDQKLESDFIKYIYWIGPNKDTEHQEDIVIETQDGKQFSFYLNKSLSSQKTASFNLFADDFIGQNIERLYGEDYLPKWNKLTQEWIRIIYENANKNIQHHIEKFIDPKRIDTIEYFEYYDIKHGDPRFKFLGEFIKELDKNILKFSDLMTEIWKNKEVCFMDSNRVFDEWMETKIVILNSKILENLFTTSLKTDHSSDIQKVENGWKLAGGTVKMKLFKTLVEKMGCLERPIYFLGKRGNDFHLVPEREFFRKHYDDLNIKFDYHVNFTVSEEEENNDFVIKIKLELDEETLIDMFITVKFSSGEMSGKLSAKYKFELSDNFNYLISKKNQPEE